MDMGALLKQAKKMQKEMKTVENELKKREYTATVGGKAVEVTVNGNSQVQSLLIKEDLLSADKKEELEELVMLCVNEALNMMISDKEETMNKLTSGIKMPGVF